MQLHADVETMSDSKTDLHTVPQDRRSLFSVRAIIVLTLWYLFSFGAIFLNKYLVDMMKAEIIVFCMWFVHMMFVANELVYCKRPKGFSGMQNLFNYNNVVSYDK